MKRQVVVCSREHLWRQAFVDLYRFVSPANRVLSSLGYRGIDHSASALAQMIQSLAAATNLQCPKPAEAVGT